MSSFDEKRRSIKSNIARSNKDFEEFDDKNQYVNNKLLTKVPTNIKYSPASGKEDMKTIESSMSPKTSKDKKDTPNATGVIGLDRRSMEIGYDEKRKEMVIGFPRNSGYSEDAFVNESRSHKKGAYEGEQYEANKIDQFDGGAISLRCDVRKANNRNKIKQQMDKISDDNNKDTIIDHNLPFHEIKTEKKYIEILNQQKKDGMLSPKEAHDAITDLENRISRKQRMNIDFLQKLDKALDNVKQQANLSSDTILLIKKRFIDELEDDGTLPNPNDSNNLNNQETNDGEVVEEEEKENESEKEKTQDVN